MVKRSLHVIWILAISAFVATAVMVLVEMTGVNLVRLAE